MMQLAASAPVCSWRPWRPDKSTALCNRPTAPALSARPGSIGRMQGRMSSLSALNGNQRQAPRSAFQVQARASSRDSLVPQNRKPGAAGNGVFALMLINATMFLCDQVLHLPMSSLYLSHSHPMWWQWVTHTFMHANWGHISNNMFFLLTFGRLVEDTEGGFGVWFTYIVCGVGAAFASYLLSPVNTVSVGASGAIFGLFVVSVLTRLQLSLKSLLESVVLGQFVLTQVLTELKSQMGGGLSLAGGLQVSHLAHLGGALAGVLLVLLLRQLPSGEDE